MSDSEENKVRERSGIINTTSTIIVIALFVIAALVLLTTGMQVYNKVVLATNENFELRTSLSYVATKIRQFDATDRVCVRDYDGMPVLVLTEEMDGDMYDTMIYFKDGSLCELLKGAEEEPEFEFGFEAMEIDEFLISQEGNYIVLKAGNASGKEEELRLKLRSE